MNSETFTSCTHHSNLRPPSYISFIRDTYAKLVPLPNSVSKLLVSSWVKVRHLHSLAPNIFCKASKNVRFDVYDIESESGPSLLRPNQQTTTVRSRGNKNISNKFIRTLTHSENCNNSRAEESDSKKLDSHLYKAPVILDESRRQAPNQTLNGEISSIQSLVVVESPSQQSENLWRASIAVGGMTCAMCAMAIKEKLKEETWIKTVLVNLIMNSVTVYFFDQSRKQEIIDIITRIGYKAVLDTVVRLAPLDDERNLKQRTIEIIVEGIICDNCPRQLIRYIKKFENISEVEQGTRENKTSFTVKYTPRHPNGTIREIIAAITTFNPSIRASIYQPPTLEERSQKLQAHERLRILIRVLFTLVIAIPTSIFGIVYMSLVSRSNQFRIYIMKSGRAGVSRAQWILFGMATPVYFFCAYFFHKRAFQEIKAMWLPTSVVPIFERFYRFGSMNMLMSLGTSIAYFSSLAQLISTTVYTEMTTDNNLFYFDSVVFLTLFLLIGRLIEMQSKVRTGNSVAMLRKLRPTEAHLLEPSSGKICGEILGQIPREKELADKIKKININLLENDDLVKVLHGESPPYDGYVTEGETNFDESSLTGESRIVKKCIGDEVYSGTINKASPITMRITGIAGASMLDQIVKAVLEGQNRKAPIERIADRLTGFFVPLIILIALLTWIFWLGVANSNMIPINIAESGLGGRVVWSLQFAIAVVVVACPCGLALAAPTALCVGSGIAAMYGILAKAGGEAFEKASKIEHIIFDKTGTLTAGGEPKVTQHRFFQDPQSNKSWILSVIKAVEKNSSHTVAKAILDFCADQELEEVKTIYLEEITGKGMKGTVRVREMKSQEIIIGNEKLILDHQAEVNVTTRSLIEQWKSDGNSIALMATKSILEIESNLEGSQRHSWKLSAIFGISDPVRPESIDVIKTLKNWGIGVWMLSGDNETTANAVGRQVGIPRDHIIADVLPEQKAERINYLQRSLKARRGSLEYNEKRALVAMVGDGINDSVALATADVGIAIGSGSDIAISSAEFILVTSNLESLITLLRLSRFILQRIKLNFAWALIYNLLALPVAAGVLYPIIRNGTHVRLDPVWASLAMAASSISVVCSSLLMRSRIPKLGFQSRNNRHELLS
ncbi:putative copper-transporting ATPase HMA5 [Golovinomyces cichoracearum]|uniref:Putative copper-transporting ATPase HMA5 n=1 Tax=Golovinomyces cichoracearum TaxID=62708 RepID=A0A420HBZ9_9PEZI|nr:putative copper-transporting ATPase HMA5 [Golovinomyces cichoracearum]